MSCQIIFCVQIDRFIFSCFFIQNLQIFYTITIRRSTRPDTIHILLNGRWFGNIQGIFCTGNMKKTAAFCRTIYNQILTCPFQCIQELLACHSQKACYITERMNFLTAIVSQISSQRIIPDTAAIHNSNIYIQIHCIKKVI